MQDEMDDYVIPYYKDPDSFVSVVRCKDCKWFHEHEMENPFCGQGVFLNYPRRDDYCSYGVRRNG